MGSLVHLAAACGLLLIPLPAAFAEEFPIRFIDKTDDAGLRASLAGLMGHGGAVGDFDGDGILDLFVGGFCDRPNAEYAPADGPVPCRLFRGLGANRFFPVDDPALEIFGRTSGALFADLDNDGTLELIVANNTRANSRHTIEPQRAAQLQRSQLLKFRDGAWHDLSDASGICPESLLSARNIGAFDYDGDGRLDLLIVEDRFRPGPARSVLLRNADNLTFRDVTAAAGLPDDVMGLGLAVADLNDDGRPDFFVPFGNRLFLSRGDGTYREAVELADVFRWTPLHGEDWPCGAAFGDLDGDGRLDLVLAIHCTTARNKVFLNRGLHDGVPQFVDVTADSGLADVVPARCPHVEIQDFDNDGRPDIYFSAAWKDDDGNIVPLIYRNVSTPGSLRFEAPRPVAEPMVYFPAGPSGDFDGDGRLDLFLINWFADNHSRLLHNNSASDNHWLQVRVAGRTFNRMGIGTKIRVYRAGHLGEAGHLLGYQEITIGYGYASGQAAIPHFGLGTVDAVDLHIRLPNGTTLERKHIAADQRLLIEEP